MFPLLLALACTPKTAPTRQVGPAEPSLESSQKLASETAADAVSECKPLDDGRTACFPTGHICSDPHGIGDGTPIVVDCWTSGGRMCHPSKEIWPACAGGWIQAG